MNEQILALNTNLYDLGYRTTSPNVFKRLLRGAVHYLSHRFILSRATERTVYAAGFRLSVPPTVFHPKLFLTSEFLAAFIGTLDLKGKRVADVGTGSGILALAAARAGAGDVTAIDINPNAVRAASINSRVNGFGSQVNAVHGNLLSSLAPHSRFDVIVSNPPLFPGEPWDMADRAWVAGPAYRDIASLFEQAYQRLNPTGVMYVILSSDSDLSLLGELIQKAGFRAQFVIARSILIESMIIYQLVPNIAAQPFGGHIEHPYGDGEDVVAAARGYQRPDPDEVPQCAGMTVFAVGNTEAETPHRSAGRRAYR
jgi:release factor glutamine methyltransferase